MLNEVLLEKLKILGDSSAISDDDFVLVLSIAKTLVVSNASNTSLKVGDAGSSSTKPEINAGVAAVLALLNEASRQNEVLRSFLEQHEFPSSRTDLLLKLQENVKSATIVGLKSVQNQLPKVVDANWSLQYTDKSMRHRLSLASPHPSFRVQ
ncbi:Hypothetical predicted protein [Cloeon dipterum]|uniref:COMM domain-containing protein 3 n=1 Tax=Cloeon dipterum TaxID=197152 RepID=A0A8S1CBI3_9INSE|nr:Hypothetical predicted protein [Cloeon dipterum]